MTKQVIELLTQLKIDILQIPTNFQSDNVASIKASKKCIWVLIDLYFTAATSWKYYVNNLFNNM